MTYQNYVMGQLVSFAVHEGFAHGAHNNMLAVAQVLRNRVTAGWNGGDWMAVLHNAPRYIGTHYAEQPPVNRMDLNFRTVLQKIDDVFHGASSAIELTSDGDGRVALYYAELHNITSPWFETNILRNLESHPVVGKVGQVTFFS